MDQKKEDLAAMRARIAASLASAHVQSILNNNSKPQSNLPPQAAMPPPATNQPGNQQHQARQQQQQQKQLTPQERERLQNLIIDSEGRTVDKRTGEIVQIESRTPTLKANLKAVQQTKRPGDNKPSSTDLFASGFASTISNSSGIVTSALPNLQSSASTSTAPGAGSEKFFDPRLK